MRKREVAISGSLSSFVELTDQRLEFDAKAGHAYRIRFQREPDQAGGPLSRVPFVQAEKVSNWIEDSATGEVVGGSKPAQ
jgi:hypothetical protein